ncbi:MAG: hypothetical protein GF398_08965 [Chitinivibrionales bacterium]|nr:hypothetical protein [Chitinivibrionales bacterium]
MSKDNPDVNSLEQIARLEAQFDAELQAAQARAKESVAHAHRRCRESIAAQMERLTLNSRETIERGMEKIRSELSPIKSESLDGERASDEIDPSKLTRIVKKIVDEVAPL